MDTYYFDVDYRPNGSGARVATMEHVSGISDSTLRAIARAIAIDSSVPRICRVRDTNGTVLFTVGAAGWAEGNKAVA